MFLAMFALALDLPCLVSYFAPVPGWRLDFTPLPVQGDQIGSRNVPDLWIQSLFSSGETGLAKCIGVGDGIGDDFDD